MHDDSMFNSWDAGEPEKAAGPADALKNDSLYEDAVRIVVSERKASPSLLQRRLRIGYGRAARLIDLMVRNGVIGPGCPPG